MKQLLIAHDSVVEYDQHASACRSVPSRLPRRWDSEYGRRVNRRYSTLGSTQNSLSAPQNSRANIAWHRPPETAASAGCPSRHGGGQRHGRGAARQRLVGGRQGERFLSEEHGVILDGGVSGILSRNGSAARHAGSSRPLDNAGDIHSNAGSMRVMVCRGRGNPAGGGTAVPSPPAGRYSSASKPARCAPTCVRDGNCPGPAIPSCPPSGVGSMQRPATRPCRRRHAGGHRRLAWTAASAALPPDGKISATSPASTATTSTRLRRLRAGRFALLLSAAGLPRPLLTPLLCAGLIGYRTCWPAKGIASASTASAPPRSS